MNARPITDSALERSSYNSAKILLIALVIAASVTGGFFAIRGGLRYYALQKLLRFHHAKERLAVKPIRRTLTNAVPIQIVNLGYATLDAGSKEQLSIRSSFDGAAVLLTNQFVSMAFFPPFAPPKAPTQKGLSSYQTSSHPKTVARITEWGTDQIAAEMEWEETEPLPASKICLMNRDDFMLYSLKVRFKAGNSYGLNRVEFFRNAETKGIVRIGQNTNDSHLASVLLSSLDGTKQVGLQLRLNNPSATNVSSYLDPILRTFRFTVETVADRDAIKTLIHAAGIQPEGNPPTQ